MFARKFLGQIRDDISLSALSDTVKANYVKLVDSSSIPVAIMATFY